MIGKLIDSALDTFDDAVAAPARAGRALGNLAEGETPTREQLVGLVQSGVSVYAIADVTGMTVDAIKEILDD